MRAAAKSLASVSDTPRLDAELLMAEAVEVSRSALLLDHRDAPAPSAFAALLARRLRHEPVAHIVGRQAFYDLELIVTPDVLIPRGDSETLIAAARAALAAPPARVLDLGTGSGALLLAALSLWPAALGVGTDRSLAALSVAAANAASLGFANRARLIRRDWGAPGWRDDLGRFDLILANPPYVEDGAPLAPQVRRFEPAGALFAGPDGLDAYRVLVPQLSALLAPDGVAVVEIGATQAEAVTRIASQARLVATLHRDLGARPRALSLKKTLGKSVDRAYLEAKPSAG
ncbi:MAG TPA: peptide chain release factor N(5)-glutamine methyltransferase [Novosphingobium sp.]|nr:peptide chain release factor N(5)-glutamine methyltransferase [Novosphingobium sp.]